MPRRSSARLNLNRRLEPQQQQPQPPPLETNPPISSVELEEIIAQRIAAALANVTRGGVRNKGNVRTARICTYKDFMNCKPMSFHGTEGIVSLTWWIEKTESVFQISLCLDECKVRFAACTFPDAALTWWNNHVNTTGFDVVNSMQWEELKRMLVEEYCPREEIHKLEQELWTLSMKGSEINASTARFNDLAEMCPTQVTPEYKKIERYIWGLTSQIKGMVIASKPTTYDSAKHIPHQLTCTEIQVGLIAESPESGTNKHKFNGKNPIQSSEERQDVASNYAATTTIPFQLRKYAGKLPWCTQCNRHHLCNCSWCSQCNHQHAGDCYICMKCKKKGHTANYCRSTTTTT
ncbi:uncharacterized protein LOC111908412 [Lactuca sativa]|uniref:Ty3 transposon capsid-like protein domain-containing protein n=1 Tax=Lactuca sativa TaxID=4236 RepID=A0A9R1VFX6_LACSA|nr:uncharacterized protein LOC111908412 [Lactuca sativa]KAJ0204030.1 hypothetical protein LSAT_V11C500239210 [Lactuca sativa]